MTDDLKPCPFCGSTSLLTPDVNHDEPYVMCADCDAYGPTADDTVQALFLWDKRARKKRTKK